MTPAYYDLACFKVALMEFATELFVGLVTAVAWQVATV